MHKFLSDSNKKCRYQRNYSKFLWHRERPSFMVFCIARMVTGIRHECICRGPGSIKRENPPALKLLKVLSWKSSLTVNPTAMVALGVSCLDCTQTHLLTLPFVPLNPPTHCAFPTNFRIPEEGEWGDTTT